MVACIPSPLGEFTPKETKMSSSNLAVRMEHAATDLLSNPPRGSDKALPQRRISTLVAAR
jgi:hypothetical protein